MEVFPLLCITFMPPLTFPPGGDIWHRGWDTSWSPVSLSRTAELHTCYCRHWWGASGELENSSTWEDWIVFHATLRGIQLSANTCWGKQQMGFCDQQWEQRWRDTDGTLGSRLWSGPTLAVGAAGKWTSTCKISVSHFFSCPLSNESK